MGEETPTVKVFKSKVKGLPGEEQAEWYRTVYRTAQTQWAAMNKSYRHFCIMVMEKDLERFLDYMQQETFWADLVTPVREPVLLLLLIYQIIQFRKEYKRKTTMRILAFGLILLFGMKLKINTLCHYWKTRAITAEELQGIKGRLSITD